MLDARSRTVLVLVLGAVFIALGSSREGEHWAYVAPVRPDVPVASTGSWGEWARNPIDAFVGRRLATEGLTPSPAADRATLIRRVSLDLTGLPPTPEEIDAFLADEEPRAYERVLDQLLASPHYGEHMARTWLDLARYADSDGYEKDETRTMWRYRDWVIDAFNRDLPFDAFTIEQIAGDLLPEPTVDQLIATGFHRNTMVNKEGGTDPEEWRVAAVKDRVDTTGTVFLGTTIECVQCHSHKYDPFTQEEYYRLYAFFDQTEDTGNSNAPEVDAPLPDQLERKPELEAEKAELEAMLEEETPELTAAYSEWRAAWQPLEEAWTTLRPSYAGAQHGSRLAVLNDDSVVAIGDELPMVDVYEVTASVPEGVFTALRLEVLTDPSLPDDGPGRPSHRNFVLNELVVHGVELASARTDHFQTNRPWPAEETIDGDLEGGWAIARGEGQSHQVLYELAEPLQGPTELRFELHQLYGGGHLIGRFRLSLAEAAVPAVDPVPAPGILEEELSSWYRTNSPLLEPVRERLDELEEEMRYPTALVMREREEKRTTHLQVRGDFLSPGREVTPGVPAVLNELDAEETEPDRLDLAQWLVAPDNPLTTRVVVNRFWERIFGVGLVATSEDFGTQGEPPSHPELLDWLALELQEQGWSLKAFHRLILTSATYRQSSNVTAELVAQDPQNRLLARGPRLRVDAEAVRDIALAASGLLCREIGGPSVYPPQPEGTWMMTYSGDQWTESEGCDRYRRGLYTFWRRTAPYPTFMMFDATSRELVCSRRARSNTPLQALATLNDPAFVECCVALARRMVGEGGATPEERARHGFRLCTGREPSADELAVLLALYAAEMQADATSAGLLTASYSDGEDVDPLELAAWTVVANALLNLDETITKG